MIKQFADLGVTLKQMREQSGFTQSNIANFLGVDQSLISKFEAGERGIASDLLEKYACLLGIQLSELSGDSAKIKPLAVNLRATEIAVEDMDTICAVNRIALNCAFLAELLEREAVNG